jgi:DNA-binding transcriptional LysR family regulator
MIPTLIAGWQSRPRTCAQLRPRAARRQHQCDLALDGARISGLQSAAGDTLAALEPDFGGTLELRHLRYFVAVAEELNFSRAAERLHMAQPPLSVAIRQLEQEVGTPLFTRTTRDVRVTDAGSAFLEGARATLAAVERTVAEARRAGSGELGRLRIAFSWGARFVTLPALGQAFRDSYPDVQLRTEEMWNARMPDALRSREVDLGVGLCPEVVDDLG